MEMVKPKKKKGRKNEEKQENVPLHDILNTDSGADENLKSTESPRQKKKKVKKNEISPIGQASEASIEDGNKKTPAKGDAWKTQVEPTDIEPKNLPKTGKPKKKIAPPGVDNPALSLADEAEIPGSIPDLQDASIDSMPAFSPPVASSTVIDDDDDHNVFSINGETKENKGAEMPRSRPTPSTPNSKTEPTPGTPASKFHRTLFGRPKSATKVKPIEEKENRNRPQTAPGYRIPFADDFSPSPSQKRPATAAATGARQAKSGRMDMTGSQKSLRETSFNTSTRSLKEGPQMEHPKQAVAYVPYMHARNALSRVIDDMKSMKMNHLSIVSQIEEQYHGIENDSREQFNAFVISLQDEQKNKISTFRQTIEAHNVEIKERNKYYTETLQSLSKRNKELLRQKRALLLAYRKDTQKLEDERNALQARLFGQTGELYSKTRILDGHLDNTTDGSKIDLEESDSEKARIAHAVPVGAVAAGAIIRNSQLGDLREIETQTDGDFIVGAFTVVDESESKWKERYEQEREEHHEQSERMERELQATRALLASSGSSTLEEREAYENKIKELSTSLAKTKLEYDTTYAFLQSIMASTDNEEQFLKAKKKIDDDRAIMLEEKKRIEKEIADWEEKWKKGHGGKLPSDDEKPDAAKELDTQLAEVNTMLANLDQQEQALIMLREGRLPEPKSGVPEPMVTTIEVRDPVLVAELETNKSQVIFLEEKLKTAQDDMTKISNLESENMDLQDKIQRYEKEMEVLRKVPIASTVALGAAAASKSHGSVEEKDAALLLKAVLSEVEILHQELKKVSQKIDKRMIDLKEKEERKLKRQELGQDTDESGDEFASQTIKQTLSEIQLSITALELIKGGQLPDDIKGLIPKGLAVSVDNQDLQDELDDARIKIDDLKMQLDAARLEGGGDFSADFAGDNTDVEDLMKKLEDHQKQIDKLENELANEQETVWNMKTETGRIQSELEQARKDLKDNEDGVNARVIAATAAVTASLKDKENEIKDCNARIDELEEARLKNLDVDARTEIERAQKETKLAKSNTVKVKKQKEELELQMAAKDQSIKSLNDKLVAQTAQQATLHAEIDTARKEKQKAVKECETKFADKERKRKAEEDAKNKILENKIRRLEAAAAAGVAVGASKKVGSTAVSDPNADRKIQRMENQITEYKRLRAEDQNRIRDLDRELKEMKASAKSTSGDKEKKAVEKKVKDLEKKLELETRKFEREQKRANELSTELEQLKKEFNDLEKKHNSLVEECAKLTAAAALGAEAAERVGVLENENKQLTSEVRTLTDNYNSERVLRKKYYNMVEDMKGKIRVYCRYRPMSKTEISNKNKPVVTSPDEYTVQVQARGNLKEFQFDQIFTDESTQEQIFEDTFNLVQSAVDGYNVCIFAYGQTGSGKTYTMIGDGGQTQPGIAPRAFKRIYDLIEENKSKLRFEVSCYMLELYNDNLLDLLTPKGSEGGKLDIKKDKKGMVFVQGATTVPASTAEELYNIFEKGSQSRHVASTKMNAESSRSHLVVAVIMESVNLTTGAVTRGKLSLVDLAGSERVGKTGATAQQLKEANSINKSLSALGDVISALSSEQSFIPYRNNKLTMLMQDSIGGNAKTLMFVNISPADYNADETAISLTYASRVKLITNDAAKNADSREVARLRTIISKLKSGESIEEDDE